MEKQGKRLTSQNLFRRTTQCKAKDPRVCPYHGAVIRMGEAEKAGDFDTYFLERLKVEEAERQGWVDEQIKTLPRDEDDTKDDIISAIDKHEPSQKMILENEKDIYDEAASKLAKEAADAVTMPISLESLTSADKEKIANNAERYGLTYEEVLKSVLKDKVAYLNVVGKATSRQGIPEKVFIEYVEKEKIVSSIVKLPASGPDAVYLIDGAIRSKQDGLTDEEISDAGVKSLDFKIVTKQGKIGYIAAKHTKRDGGGQDNQYEDILHTLKHYNKPNSDFLLIANVDGEYYTKHRKKHNKNYIEFMKEKYKDYPDVLITTYKTFKSELGNL